MKRTLSFLCVLTLCISIFIGCSEREIIPIEYTYEVLVDKETPDESLVWAGRFETPAKSGGLLLYNESEFFGIVERGNIQAMQLNLEDEYIGPYLYTTKKICKLLKMRKEELPKKIQYVNIPRKLFILGRRYFIPFLCSRG